jgi:hypothetical protein
MALIHLVYVSSACGDLDDAELDHILASAVRRNSQQQVTGILLYVGGNFMQVLEGEATAVDEVFAHIERDPRHTNIIVLEREPIPERSFGRWSMGFRRLGAPDAATRPDFVPIIQGGFDAARAGARPGVVLEMLQHFGASLT